MLVGPYANTSTFSTKLLPDDATQYRPSKDLDTFRTFLGQPIEFVESSTSSNLAVPEGKYQPINVAAVKSERAAATDTTSSSVASTSKSSAAASTSKSTAGVSLYSRAIDSSWPSNISNIGSGLHNMGNTCFLNSALQCLLHTAPLLRVVADHECKVKSGFCMICAFRTVIISSHGKTRKAFTPTSITTKLNVIAKHMRRGRQEDSHEFLRYAIDAMQKSCLAGQSPKIDAKLAETTWVHQIFGGQLRSRVTCTKCGYNSDTFDSILDLSLDITNTHTLKEALRKFVAVDHLKGADKYKCDKCKIPVAAEKQFTLQRAPLVLTVHLKRFSPLGRKIGHVVRYEERLSLSSVMSDKEYGPSYSLYGVICHAGGGPNSGHYFAYVKGKADKWFEMNDESVFTAQQLPFSHKNAYILFYQRDKGQALQAAVASKAPIPSASPKAGIIGGMKKRKANDDDVGVKTEKPFIGPILPSTPNDSPNAKRAKMSPLDPQADAIKKKIQAAAMSKLVEYGSDSDDTESKDPNKATASSSTQFAPSTSLTPATSTTDGSIAPQTFYAQPPSSKKRKNPSEDSPRSSPFRPKPSNQFNPFGGGRLSQSFSKSQTYAKKRRPRGL